MRFLPRLLYGIETTEPYEGYLQVDSLHMGQGNRIKLRVFNINRQGLWNMALSSMCFRCFRVTARSEKATDRRSNEKSSNNL